MGGAQRNQRKRQQQSKQSARAVAAARGQNSTRNKTIAGVAVVVVLAAAVISGVLVTNSNKQQQRNAVIPAASSQHQYPTKLLNNDTVLAGKNSAKIKLDFYEDFICPICGEFYKVSHQDVDNALASGKIQVRFHMVDILDQSSQPPGYSLRAASASLAAAKQGKFMAFYNSLYQKQPGEGSAAYSNAQLINLGKRLGLGDTFAAAVKSGKYKSEVKQGTLKGAKTVSAFYQKKYHKPSFGTPSVLYQGKALDVLPRQSASGQLVKSPWLQDLLKGKVDLAPAPKNG